MQFDVKMKEYDNRSIPNSNLIQNDFKESFSTNSNIKYGASCNLGNNVYKQVTTPRRNVIPVNFRFFNKNLNCRELYSEPQQQKSYLDYKLMSNKEIKTNISPPQDATQYDVLPKISKYMSPITTMKDDTQVVPPKFYTNEAFMNIMPSEFYFNDKSIKEKIFISELNKVNPECAEGLRRLSHVPLPLLERLDCNTMPHKRSRSVPRNLSSSTGCKLCKSRDANNLFPNISAYLANMRIALAHCCDDVKAIICPEKCYPDNKCNLENCATVPIPTEPKCSYCGYIEKYCPECGSLKSNIAMSRIYTQPAALAQNESEEFDYNSCELECVEEHFNDDVFCNKLNDICKHAGEFIDEAITDCLQSCFSSSLNCFSQTSFKTKYQEEGYAMYEPIPYLARREKPTRATGNCCIDNVNAMLDQCCTTPHEQICEYYTPKIQDTENTGNWVVDKLNKVLDDCCYEPEPAPQPIPQKKKKCTLNCTLNPLEYCTETQIVPPTPPPEPTCCLKNFCQLKKSKCPTCNQELRKPVKRIVKKEPCCSNFVPCSHLKSKSLENKPRSLTLVYPYKEKKELQTADYFSCCANEFDSVTNNTPLQPIALVDIPPTDIKNYNKRNYKSEELYYFEPLYDAQTLENSIHSKDKTSLPTCCRSSTTNRSQMIDGRLSEECFIPIQQLNTIYMPPNTDLSSRPSKVKTAPSLSLKQRKIVPVVTQESCLMSQCCMPNVEMH